MNGVLQQLIRGSVVALAGAVLSGCAVTTGAGQGQLAFRASPSDRYTVCTSVYASRLRERAVAEGVCRRAEEVRVIL